MHTFSPNTRARSQEVNENFTELSNGTGDTDNNRLQLFRAETCFDFVQSGLIWTLVSGLNGTMTAGVAYIADGSNYMQRLVVAQIVSRAFTASKDTYVDLGSDGTIYYSEVANGATAPSLSSNRMRIALVITNGSTITAIYQTEQSQANTTLSDRGWCGLDNIGNPVRNTSPYEMEFMVARHNGTASRTVGGDPGAFTTIANMSQKYKSGRSKEKICLYISNMYIFTVSGGTARHMPYVDGVAIYPQQYDQIAVSQWSTFYQAQKPYYMNANTTNTIELKQWMTSTYNYVNSSTDQQYTMPTLIIRVTKAGS